MDWRDAALAMAGIIGSSVAVFHGILTQRLMVGPVEALFVADARIARPIRRLVPLLLQNGLGFSALHSGLSVFSEALGGMTGTQVASRIYKRVGPRRLMIAATRAASGNPIQW